MGNADLPEFDSAVPFVDGLEFLHQDGHGKVVEVAGASLKVVPVEIFKINVVTGYSGGSKCGPTTK